MGMIKMICVITAQGSRLHQLPYYTIKIYTRPIVFNYGHDRENQLYVALFSRIINSCQQDIALAGG